MSVMISCEGDKLHIRFPYNELDTIKAQNIPDRRWDKNKQAWVCRPTLANIQYIDETWSRVEWDNDAQAKRDEAYEKQQSRKASLAAKNGGQIDTSSLDVVPFKMPPLDYQKIALLLGRDQPVFAYLMDQGTGKTKVAIDDACHNWREDNIDVVIVFTLNSVKTNWVIFDSMKDDPSDKDALEAHMPDDVPYIKGVWSSQQDRAMKKEWHAFEAAITEQITKRDKLVWLAANIESLIVDRAMDFYETIVQAFGGRVMIIIDESTLIGAPGSKRTRAAIKLRKPCSKARILSGTPVIKSPTKAYSQFGFLDEDILGFGSFYSFKNHFCVMHRLPNNIDIIQGFKNLGELNEKIASVSYRVMKEDVLNLPPQEFIKRRVEMTKEQAKAYAEMHSNFLTKNEDAGTVHAKIVLEQMLRLQQITGGYLPKMDGDMVVGISPLMEPKRNPKFREVLNLLEEGGEQRMIIWSRFTHEIVDLVELLNAEGFPTMPFYGALSDKEKISVRKSFARDKKYRTIVGNPAAGGLGIDEFKYASLVANITNSFDTERRVQSEDRTHRIGSEMHDKITYFDIIIPNTVDIKVLQIMRNNVKISNAVMGDEWREWV